MAQREQGADSGIVPTISELVERSHRDSGLSYREMSERAARAGLQLHHQTLQSLATASPKAWPKHAETIRAIAEACDVPERLVVLAFARSFGLDVHRGESLLAMSLPAGVAEIDERVQRSVVSLLRTLVSTQEDSDAAATTRAGASPADLADRQRAADEADVAVIYGAAADRGDDGVE